MSNKLKGINIPTTIVPFTSDDNFPTHEAKYGKGGFRCVETKLDLDKIPQERRENGMIVFVINDLSNIHFYQLLEDKWVVAKLIGGFKAVSNEEFKKTAKVGDLNYVKEDNSLYFINSIGELEKINLINVIKSDGKDDLFVLMKKEDGTSDLIASDNLKWSKNQSLDVNGVVKIRKTVLKAGEDDSRQISVALPSKPGQLALIDDVYNTEKELTDYINETVDVVSSSVKNSQEYLDFIEQQTLISSNNTPTSIFFNKLALYNDSDINSFVVLNNGWGEFLSINFNNDKLESVTINISYKEFITDTDFNLLSDTITVSKYNDKIEVLLSTANDSRNFGYSVTNNTVKLLVKCNIELIARIVSHSTYNADDNTKAESLINNISWPLNNVGGTSFYALLYHDSKQFDMSTKNITVEVEDKVAEKTLRFVFNDSNKPGTENWEKERDLKLREDYTTFIIDCNKTIVSNREDDLIFVSEELDNELDLYNKSFKFIFLQPNEFTHFKIKYGNQIVVSTSDFNVSDGECLYVTPKNINDNPNLQWSYYIGAELPPFDHTLTASVNNAGKPCLSVSNEVVYFCNYDSKVMDKTEKLDTYVEFEDTSNTMFVYVKDDVDVLRLRIDPFNFSDNKKAYIRLLGMKGIDENGQIISSNIKNGKLIKLIISHYSNGSFGDGYPLETIEFKSATIYGSVELGSIRGMIKNEADPHLNSSYNSSALKFTIDENSNNSDIVFELVSLEYKEDCQMWRCLNSYSTGDIITKKELNKILDDAFND